MFQSTVYPGTDKIPSLKRSAMVIIGKQIWQRPAAEQFIEFLFYSNTRQDRESKRVAWDTFNTETLKSLNVEHLGSSLKCELLHVIKGMGEELYYWHEYVAKLNICYYGRFQCELDYPAIQFWTRFGTLDTSKMIEVSWMRNVDRYNVSAVYNVACRRGIDRENVVPLWEVENFCPTMGDATSLYYSQFRQFDLDHPLDLVALVDDALQTIVFQESVDYGNSELVQTTWKELKGAEKKKVLSKCFQQALNKHRNCGESFERKKYAEIILFMFGEMSNEQKKRISEESAVEVMKILSEYPWHDLFLPILMEMKNLKIVKDELLDRITEEHYTGLNNILV